MELSSRAVIFSQCAQELLVRTMPHYLVRGTDFFSLRLSNKKMSTANTAIAMWCECSVLNHKYIGHMIELHLIGHVAY